MIKRMRSLSRQRKEILARMDRHRHELQTHRQQLNQSVRNWMGTPQSLVQAFVAGFMIDQTRPLVPEGPSPLKFIPLILRFFI